MSRNTPFCFLDHPLTVFHAEHLLKRLALKQHHMSTRYRHLVRAQRRIDEGKGARSHLFRINTSQL